MSMGSPVFPALEETDRIHAQPGVLGQGLLREAGRVPMLPQEIAKGQMLTGVQYLLSLTCMVGDSRLHDTLPVRAHNSTLPTPRRSLIARFIR
jgi:hypothetical protein